MSPLALEYDSKFRYNLDFLAGLSASKEIKNIKATKLFATNFDKKSIRCCLNIMYLHIFDLNQTYRRLTLETDVGENESHVL